MSRKPTDPRPDRRYNPVPADLPLDHIRSASAIVAPFGVLSLPVSMAALFADAGPEAQALSFQIQTQTSALADESDRPPFTAPTQPSSSGSGVPDVGPGGPSLAYGFSSTIATVGLQPDDTDSTSLFRNPASPGTAGGGGALRGRGGSGGPSGQIQPSAASAQPFNGTGSGPSFFGGRFFGGGAGSAQNPGNPQQAPPSTTAASQPGQEPGSAQTAPAGAGAVAAEPDVPGNVGSNLLDRRVLVRRHRPRRPSHGPELWPSKLVDQFQHAWRKYQSTEQRLRGGPGHIHIVIPRRDNNSAPGASSTGPSSTGETSSDSAASTSPAQSGSTSGGLGGIADSMMPVGGGAGGVFGQAWRYQQSPPSSAPYSTGPVAGSTEAAPFNTLNALIFSYIDNALGNINPINTGGVNEGTTPPGMTVTATDGLGTYTFSASATYDIDGTYVAGSFSTTDSATLNYSFHESGYTPDGDQFTLTDTGGGTLNVHADDGNSTTHYLDQFARRLG